MFLLILLLQAVLDNKCSFEEHLHIPLWIINNNISFLFE